MPKLYLMTGRPGSGKTTFAKAFAEENGLRYLGIDDFYKYINGDDRIRSHKFEVWMAFYRTIHLAEEDGVSVVVDVNAPNVIDRTEFINWFPSYEHHLIWVDAPKELCKANNKRRRRQIPDAEMDRLLDSYIKPDYLNGDDRWENVTLVLNRNNEFYSDIFKEALE